MDNDIQTLLPYHLSLPPPSFVDPCIYLLSPPFAHLSPSSLPTMPLFSLLSFLSPFSTFQPSLLPVLLQLSQSSTSSLVTNMCLYWVPPTCTPPPYTCACTHSAPPCLTHMYMYMYMYTVHVCYIVFQLLNN